MFCQRRPRRIRPGHEPHRLVVIGEEEARRLGHPFGTPMPRDVFIEWSVSTTRRFLDEHCGCRPG